MLFLGPFSRAKTMRKLLWNSKNVTNITKALNLREKKHEIINVSWSDGEIRIS